MTDQLFSDFVDAWNAGRRPQVRTYLERAADDASREALAEQLDTFLDVAPTPDYSDAARAEIRASPMLARVLAAADQEGGLWPQLLPELRASRRLSLAELAARVRARFSLPEAEQERTAELLGRMETGELEPAGVSRRLLDALGDLLGVSPARLAEAGSFARGLQPAAAGAGHLFRAEGDAGAPMAADLSVLADAARAPAPPPLDELERLFLGGPAG